MVSLRCKLIVKSELEKLGLHFIVVELGEIEILEEINDTIKKQLQEGLLKFNFELLEDKKSILIEKIKNIKIN